jgi:small-conductance mechanosensitive channel
MEWPLSLPLTIYLGVILLVALGILIWVLTFIRSTRRVRKQRLRKRKLQAALETSSPLGNPIAAAREHGLESIEKHFTVTRRVAVPAVIGLAAIATGLPFLADVPAAFLSLVAASVAVLFGIAARPVVENAIAGVVIAHSKLINIGDSIRVDDHYGTIEDVTTTHTTVKLWDWRRYVVPNSAMLQMRLL